MDKVSESRRSDCVGRRQKDRKLLASGELIDAHTVLSASGAVNVIDGGSTDVADKDKLCENRI